MCTKPPQKLLLKHFCLLKRQPSNKKSANTVTLSILLRENTNKKSIIHVKNTLFKNFRRQSVFFLCKIAHLRGESAVLG